MQYSNEVSHAYTYTNVMCISIVIIVVSFAGNSDIGCKNMDRCCYTIFSYMVREVMCNLVVVVVVTCSLLLAKNSIAMHTVFVP